MAKRQKIINLTKGLESYQKYQNASEMVCHCNGGSQYEYYRLKRDEALDEFYSTPDVMELDEIIRAVQVRAKTRLITVEDVYYRLLNVIKKLGVPKKHLSGCRVYIDDNAQRFPNAYKNKAYANPRSTTVCVENVRGAWRVVSVQRADCEKDVIQITNMPEELKSAIIEKYMRW